jgi:hypothetical protein
VCPHVCLCVMCVLLVCLCVLLVCLCVLSVCLWSNSISPGLFRPPGDRLAQASRSAKIGYARSFPIKSSVPNTCRLAESFPGNFIELDLFVPLSVCVSYLSVHLYLCPLSVCVCYLSVRMSPVCVCVVPVCPYVPCLCVTCLSLCPTCLSSRRILS